MIIFPLYTVHDEFSGGYFGLQETVPIMPGTNLSIRTHIPLLGGPISAHKTTLSKNWINNFGEEILRCNLSKIFSNKGER